MSGYYVYVHISPNDKKYFGITKRYPTGRWKNGYGYASSPHFYNAILKYGWDNFQHIILVDNLSKEWACQLERDLIWKYQSNNPKYGYNVCDGGEGTNGYHHSESTKQKLRQSTINSLNNGQREQIAQTVRQRWEDGVYANRKYNQVAWNKGLTKDTDERIAKNCRKVGEFNHTLESRRKMSESHKGKPAHNRKRVLCVETGVIYDSISEAQNITGINNISLATRKVGRTAGKLHWRYVND